MTSGLNVGLQISNTGEPTFTSKLDRLRVVKHPIL